MNAGLNKQLSAFKYVAPGAMTVLIALIVITPLCGLLFACGCTWPGAGLEENCNYYAKAAIYRCPWCNSMTAGSLSVGLALFAGYFVAMNNRLSMREPVREFRQLRTRVCKGLVIFILVAVVCGWVSAEIQGYPFLGSVS